MCATFWSGGLCRPSCGGVWCPVGLIGRGLNGALLRLVGVPLLCAAYFRLDRDDPFGAFVGRCSFVQCFLVQLDVRGTKWYLIVCGSIDILLVLWWGLFVSVWQGSRLGCVVSGVTLCPALALSVVVRPGS